MRFLVEGTAGFIGVQLTSRLPDDGPLVVSVDNFSDCYGVRLNDRRNATLEDYEDFRVERDALEGAEVLNAASEIHCHADYLRHAVQGQFA